MFSFLWKAIEEISDQLQLHCDYIEYMNEFNDYDMFENIIFKFILRHMNMDGVLNTISTTCCCYDGFLG